MSETITFRVKNDLYLKINEYRDKNKHPDRTQALISLIENGIEYSQLEQKEIEIESMKDNLLKSLALVNALCDRVGGSELLNEAEDIYSKMKEM